jgi:hypothetical protein
MIDDLDVERFEAGKLNDYFVVEDSRSSDSGMERKRS